MPGRLRKSYQRATNADADKAEGRKRDFHSRVPFAVPQIFSSTSVYGIVPRRKLKHPATHAILLLIASVKQPHLRRAS